MYYFSRYFPRLSLFLFSLLMLMPDVVQAQSADGNLFISPQRLELTDQKKTGQLHLVNKSSETKTYEIKMKDYAMNAAGSLGDETESLAYSAKKMVRFSPRRVTLQGGEDQYVRVMLKLPRELEDGGYHSHIEFNEIENAHNRKANNDDTGDGQVSFKVGASYGVAIPVFINKGDAKADVKLGDVAPQVQSGTAFGAVTLNLNRSGTTSGRKLVHIHYIDASGAEHLAGTPTRISVYREADVVKREMVLKLPDGVVFAGGQLKVTLSNIGKPGSEEEITDQKVVPLS